MIDRYILGKKSSKILVILFSVIETKNVKIFSHLKNVYFMLIKIIWEHLKSYFYLSVISLSFVNFFFRKVRRYW